MHNKVVTMAARAMRELGATTVRFNFRGTGDSEGAFDEGRGEVDDLHAVAAWVREQRPGDALWRSEEHTSELQSLMRISYAGFCLKKKTRKSKNKHNRTN